MSEISKLGPEILAKIKSANHILLHNHPSPDADSVGGALAMMWVLKGMGKQVTVIGGDSAKQSSFEALPGYDQVIPQSWSETDLSKYDLFLSLDSASVGQVSSKSGVVFPSNLFTIVIDHHSSNTKYGDINLVDPEFSSNSQLLFELISSWDQTITPEISRCLILGIYTDSGGFRYPPTNFRTFEDVAKITKIIPDYNQTISALYDHNSLGRVKFLGLALSSLKLYCRNKVAVASIPYSSLVEKQIDASDTEKSEVANYLKSINGVEIGVTLCEKELGQVNISFRSRDPQIYNVAKIAVSLGGGGHPGAAATRLNTTFDEALQALEDAIKNTYPELSQP